MEFSGGERVENKRMSDDMDNPKMYVCTFFRRKDKALKGEYYSLCWGRAFCKRKHSTTVTINEKAP